MSSSVAARSLIRCRNGLLYRQRQNVARCFCTSQQFASASDETADSSRSAGSLLAATALMAFLKLQRSDQNDDGTKTRCETSSVSKPERLLFPPNITTAEPRKYMTNRMAASMSQQPRNVMPLHRMTSTAGRGLKDKYNVDWKTVLGEGAYGSVHPARVAATGEKVRVDGFFLRLLRSSSSTGSHILLPYTSRRSLSRKLPSDLPTRPISKQKPMPCYESLTMEAIPIFQGCVTCTKTTLIFISFWIW
jgi:hypothetical protein